MSCLLLEAYIWDVASESYGENQLETDNENENVLKSLKIEKTLETQ